jgi:ATP-binding cassette subfamily C protein
MVLLLALSGVMEGFGIAAVLPLIEFLVSPGEEPSALAAAIADGLATVGLEPSVPVLLGGIVLMFTLKNGLYYLAMLQVGAVVSRVEMELRLRLLRAVTRAEWRHMLSYPSGFIANAVSREAGRSATAYQTFAAMMAEGMQVLAYLTVAFLISWRTATATIVVGGLIILLLQGRVTASRKAGREQVYILRSILARLTDALPSLKPLKAMGMEHYLLPRLEEQTEQFYHARVREIASTELLKRAREPILMAALALGLGGVLAFTEATSTSIMILGLLFYRTATSITNMQQRWVTVVVGENSFQSLMEHIRTSEDARETWAVDGDKPVPTFARELDLDAVRFSYGEHEVLKGVTATLPAGRFVALVGPSGSGKTTLTDLITGLLRPTSGRIVIDGVDLAECDIRGWRHHIGYVPQEPMLFSDSILANLTLGADTITRDDAERALRDAHAWEFVSELEGGLDHPIGEGGTSLSGGQRQRLAIARALVQKPGLMILDEPTTALDADAEAEVCRTLSDLRGGLTILAISHQPAIRELADEVWELDKGRLNTPVRPAPVSG